MAFRVAGVAGAAPRKPNICFELAASSSLKHFQSFTASSNPKHSLQVLCTFATSSLRHFKPFTASCSVKHFCCQQLCKALLLSDECSHHACSLTNSAHNLLACTCTRTYVCDAAHNLLSSRPYHNSSLFRDPSRDMASTNDDWRVNSLVEVESDLLRKKHLARFTPDELALLLEEMGFDRLDLRGFRINHISGATLLAMSEDDMAVDLVLPRSKTRKLRALQRATHLFDRIATLPRQGKISEVELRLFLASQGAGTAEVDKIVKLFKTLVRTDKYDFVTFWDFVTSYDWIAQALRIYNIPT
ncbi:hypothetical protein DUNSADRAFT_1032 [Dunaliella salina]|uniref:Uncharacterized protein n=1 Tax=Dunaliella salina TaxID=3046 RepID=A0ABQ7GXK6_DUNSA|nr:hypothetical protein DUNSADRAFT_1032 [Dunaliella salina]|eukprot:KAF5839348.1 hypothetical protein DUNSADRAFT_1032 [Dunaliella salina]